MSKKHHHKKQEQYKKKSSSSDLPPIGKVHVGVFHSSGRRHGMLSSCHRKDTFPGITIEDTDILKTLNDGDVVVYTLRGGVQILKHLGSIHDPKVFAMMAIYAREMPCDFSEEALADAAKGDIPPLKGREDYRDIPLVTIDGEDAKDFDDAVYARPDDTVGNEGGWRLTVAIADVSYYVKPNSELDIEAKERGNSVYFPNTVVPMLPESLSNELCSLKPHVDRACLAVDMTITSTGKLKNFKFKRALMRSYARLTYTQVQQVISGNHGVLPEGFDVSIIQNLYGAYKSLRSARNQRGSLELNLPEYKILFDEEQRITGVQEVRGEESNQLIEEFMVLANVCAAKALLAKSQPTLFRVHDAPDNQRFTNLMDVLQAMHFQIPKKKTSTPHFFNEVLLKAKDKPFQRLINDMVLRCQAQARYSVNNIGHFGLGLAHYCHFTSPIRRYADLIVHRGLVTSLGLGQALELPASAELFEIADYISFTEKRATQAEREVRERMIAQYLVPHIGEEFLGTITGVSGAGLFVGLNGIGADGFIGMGDLKGDYYVLDERQQRLIGRRSKQVYQLGQSVLLKLVASNPLTTAIQFVLVEKESPRVDRLDPSFDKKRFPKEDKDKSKGKKKPFRKHKS